MRKTTSFWKAAVLFAAIAAAGCVRDNEPAVPSDGRAVMTITAGKTALDNTRTELGEDYLVTWRSEDALGVFTRVTAPVGEYLAVNERFTISELDTDTGYATFTGEYDPYDGTPGAVDYFAYYPYRSGAGDDAGTLALCLPAKQYPTADSFDGAADIQFGRKVATAGLPVGHRDARGNPVNFVFERPFAIGGFTFTDIPAKVADAAAEEVVSVVLTFDDGLDAAGDFTAVLDGGGYSVSGFSDGVNAVELDYTGKGLIIGGLTAWWIMAPVDVTSLSVEIETVNYTISKVFDLGTTVLDFQANAVNRAANVSLAGANVVDKGGSGEIDIASIVSVAVTTPPSKTSYGLGEPIDLTGLVVTATDDRGVDFELPDPGDYLVNGEDSFASDGYFLTTGTKTIGVEVGSAPSVSFDIEVKSIFQRLLDVAGTTATLVLYVDETTPASLSIIELNSDITLTTPEGSTEERILKRVGTGYGINLVGQSGSTAADTKLTLDGYVTIKGWAKPEYGGTDTKNNTSYLVNVQRATLEMKGHSKITGNCNASGNNTGGGLYINSGNLIVGGNARICDNWVVPTSASVAYGGAFYLVGSTATIRDNAVISGNVAQQNAGNAYGGAGAGEGGSVLYIEGGEISGNSARSLGENSSGASVAGGGAFQLTGYKIYVSGGVFRDNYVIYGKTTRGSAINVAGGTNALTLSGGATFIPGGDIEEVVIGGSTYKKDPGNAISLTDNGGTGVLTFAVDGPLSTTHKINLDLQSKGSLKYAGCRVMVDTSGGMAVNFTDNAPGDKFTLRNRSNTSANVVDAISGYVIGGNGTLVAEE